MAVLARTAEGAERIIAAVLPPDFDLEVLAPADMTMQMMAKETKVQVAVVEAEMLLPGVAVAVAGIQTLKEDTAETPVAQLVAATVVVNRLLEATEAIMHKVIRVLAAIQMVVQIGVLVAVVEVQQ